MTEMGYSHVGRPTLIDFILESENPAINRLKKKSNEGTSEMTRAVKEMNQSCDSKGP